MMSARFTSFLTFACFVVGVLAAGPVSAQDAAAVDEDIATTPTALGDLLGPDGLASAEVEFYLLMQMNGEDSEVLHWQTTVEDGLLTFTSRTWQAAGGMQSIEIDSSVYSSEGEFVESMHGTQGDGWSSSIRRVREENTIRVTRTHAPDLEPVEEDDIFDYQPIDGVLPSAWMPLMLAYHIREGHDVFQGRMVDQNMEGWAMVDVFTVEDVGTEEVEIGGYTFEAHVMLVTSATVLEGDLPDNMSVEWDESERLFQMYVLPDGSIVRMRAEFEGMVMSAQAITAQEAEEFMAGGRGADEDFEDAGDAAQ